MSEMLGNQYFMARNYTDAVREFEFVLSKYPSNKPVKKKLIICYSQTGKVKKAVDYFYDLITEDIEFIIDTDSVKDDCPCPELVQSFEKDLPVNHNSTDFHTILGMIWLFCDINKSVEYFIKAQELVPDNPLIKNIIEILESYLRKKSILRIHN